MKRYTGPVGTCNVCKKLCFMSRQAAKNYAHNRLPGERFSIYKCDDYFHYGHIPYGVKRGMADRHTISRPI